MITKASTIFSLLSMFIGFSFYVSPANALNTDNVPDALQQWVPWVIKDQPSILCPVIYNQNKKLCAYPSSLKIRVKGKEGKFTQQWGVQAPSWITLPGDDKNWPSQVTVNDKIHPVIKHNGKPSLYLNEGKYIVKGQLNWHQAPKSITIPYDTGRVELIVDKKNIPVPDFRQGKLWLKTTDIVKSQNNRLDIQVFRKITDTIPLQLTTQLKLDVSGQPREIILEGALLANFKPKIINSRLPSQLDSQGRLKIQIRPGQWTLDIMSFQSQSLTSIALPEFNDSNTSPWPETEIWVLDAQPQLRLIKVINKNSIDPNQTHLPSSWKSLPAYTMAKGESLNFDVIKRGNSEPEPDQLTLTKKIWLDFDGKGLTVNDKINGQLSSQWRLNVIDGMSLGQVTLNGQPQFITQNKQNQQGVEVRHGQLNLSADSRMESDTRSFSATGWDMDFNKVTGTLYLPAGWQLLSLSGANTHAWIDQWTLLDLFMVLITAIAIYKMWGVSWGVISLVALILVWHESMSPQYIWINLAVAAVLIRSLPSGRFFRFVKGYQMVAAIVLVLILLTFMVTQIRTALYPQLVFDNMQVSQPLYAQNVQIASPPSLMQAPVEMASRAREEIASSSYSDKLRFKQKRAIAVEKKSKMISVDPDAVIQTGPGLPSWSLHEYRLWWDGPVRADQTLSMILLSPAVHSLLNIVRVALVLLLAWRLLNLNAFKPSNFSKGSKNNASVTAGSAPAFIGLILFGGFLSTAPIQSQAAFPDKALLDQLKKEITKPAKCLPNCAAIENMNIDLSANNLTVTLKVHAQEKTLIPLPIPIKQWMPDNISVNEKPAKGLIRRDESTLWIQVGRGTHQVILSGRAAFLNQLQFVFPLKPHDITTKIQNWTMEGWDEQTHKISALSFLRVIDKKNAAQLSELEQNEISVYAKVSREIELGLDWQVTTTVSGMSGSAYPVILSVPLLKGESVISENIKVKNQYAIITLSQHRRTVRFSSKLAIHDRIELQASEQGQFIEKWTLSSSPIWHIQTEGIPVIYHQRNSGSFRPEWQPWPGEKIAIDVSRPQGIKGNTVTIDYSTLTLTPGEQITTAKLQFNLRSSLGGQHTIQLPENVTLQTVSINNQAMPIRETAQGLSLPISPGNQKIEIIWREARGVSTIFNSSTVDLGSNSVNSVITIKPGNNRWVLFASGPKMGPAVLFWGMFIVILIIAAGLGHIKETPLNTLQWIILGIGLSASQPGAVVIIAGSIFALRYRSTLDVTQMSRVKFNGFQILLIILIFLSITSLLAAIEQGLLGSPDMQITGNGSSMYQLNWYADRINSSLSSAMMISVPVYIYQLMMLAWSIWLAFALIKWAQWGWEQFSKQEYWRSIEGKLKQKDE